MSNGIQGSSSGPARVSAVQSDSLKVRYGRYVHFKGQYYVVIGVGKRADTDSDEIFVTYVSEADARVWVRSLADFTAYVNRTGDINSTSYQGPRFLKVEESEYSTAILSVLRECCWCGQLVGENDLSWDEVGLSALHRGVCSQTYAEKVLGK